MTAPLEAHRAGGPSFSIANRAHRVLWGVAWLMLARWTPPPMHRWRAALLRTFGAKVGRRARVYGSTRVWLPRNLSIGDQSVLGPRVRCYNQGHITIGDRVTVSQDASLCASSHDVSDPHFQLVLRPITIDDDAWIAAEAFVGPAVKVGAGALLGARGVAMRDLEPWTIYTGNPATALRKRRFRTTGRPAGG
ncbi:putative colanic acid biosynthesis acetyltransferase [Sphingomonas sp. RP10(2022)]|uniref:Colanic acid biosynthesis acetyltransferase n=1 Tax=Sphingomonas liriopis TaxID=2949094 RepID=A0A9X2HZ84_9SPHN|nr:putative colanic acid biosynthesis acetyltransferase [Sphingomonas liriopis]MCP3736174.1 putative colanic acid biosynthesis acetyltransferase [Sphingomonas liriopis]